MIHERKRSGTGWLRVTAAAAAAAACGAGQLPEGPAEAARFAAAQQQKITAGDGAAHNDFGFSVALSGDTALVGSTLDDAGAMDSGSAYVFVREGDAWAQQAKLVPLDPGASDYFGMAVAISGDTALVGASHDDELSTDSGAVYVFVRSGGAWAQQAKLLPADGAGDDSRFGAAVALSGSTAIVGAPYDGVGTDSGAAYVFVRSGAAWVQQAKLLASDGAALDAFGAAVALSGDTALVGSANHDGPGGDDAGVAYVFQRNGNTWAQQAKLSADDAAPGALLGCSVSLSGDTALVGARHDDAAASHAGSAYVFLRTGAAWGQQAKLLATGGNADDELGHAVSLSGSAALVGAWNAGGAGGRPGAAYAFERVDGVWGPSVELLRSDGRTQDLFGFSVAIEGATALVGANYSDAPAENSGSAYLYGLSPAAGEGPPEDGVVASGGGCGCHTAARPRTGSPAAAVPLLGLALLTLRRRRAPSRA